MLLDRDKGCHGDAAYRKVTSSGSVLWLGSEILHLQHKFLEKGIVLCLFVLCCDCWERFPIHDIGSPGFVCVKQSLRNRMCWWVSIVEAAILLLILPPLHSVTFAHVWGCARVVRKDALLYDMRCRLCQNKEQNIWSNSFTGVRLCDLFSCWPPKFHKV